MVHVVAPSRGAQAVLHVRAHLLRTLNLLEPMDLRNEAERKRREYKYLLINKAIV